MLDAEVSELDRRLVAAHLACCAECRAFEVPVRAFTDELRVAPLESPRRPIVLARTRPQRRLRLTTAEFSVAATLLIGIGLLGAVSQFEAPDSKGQANRLTTANLFTTSWQPQLELAQIEPSAPTEPTDWPGPLSAL